MTTSSESFNHEVSNTSKDDEVYECRGWVHFVAILDGNASGENKLSTGGEFVTIEPGVTVNTLLGPGTKIRIKSTGNSVSQWAIFLTELTFINDFFGALCQLGGGRG